MEHENNSRRVQAFRRHAAVKGEFIKRAQEVDSYCMRTLGRCSVDQLEECKEWMKKIQWTWKTVGSAGYQEKALWKEFCAIQDRFWGYIGLLIRLEKLKMRIAEIEEEENELRDRFECTRNEEYRLSLIDQIDRKCDKGLDLADQAGKIEDQLRETYGIIVPY